MPLNLLINNFFYLHWVFCWFLPTVFFIFLTFLELQSSCFHVAFLYYIFVEEVLLQYDLSSSAFHCLFLPFFSSFILFWSFSIGASFSYTLASCLLDHSSIYSILSCFSEISSWALFFKLISSSKSFSNVLRCVFSSFILFRWSNGWHSFLATFNIYNWVLVFFIVNLKSIIFCA